MSDRLAPWRRGRARHDPGKVVLDLAVAIALGGDCLADVAVVRAQPDLFGAVASDPTASRLVAALAADGDAAVDALRAATLAGDRDEPVAVYDQLGQLTSHTVRKVPVLSPAQPANLPARRVGHQTGARGNLQAKGPVRTGAQDAYSRAGSSDITPDINR